MGEGRIDLNPNVMRTGLAYMRRVDGRKVTCLTLRDLHSCPQARTAARWTEGATEVSRGRSSRGASSGANPTYSTAKGRTK